ncbi:MAG: glycosyltransferase [Planctomycetota bacterium]
MSVVIPTYGRPDKLRRCLESLAAQETSRSFEVVVGVDGGSSDPAAFAVISAAAAGVLGGRARCEAFEKLGLIALRKRFVERARGRLLVSLNDDVYASPGLVEAHAEAHDGPGSPVVVTGPAPWRPVNEPTAFDAVVHRTDLVFFAPAKPPAPGPFVVGYRDCYGLNLSAQTSLVREVGGFPDLRDAYGYDDIELAYRLQNAAGCRAVHHPGAAVTHDHRMTPADVMRREYLLGRSAWAYADLNPAFAMDLFGRDIRTPDELAFSVSLLRQGHADAVRIERAMLDLGSAPGDAIDAAVLRFIAEGWRGLKRYLWRWGLLDACASFPSRWSLLRDLDAAPHDPGPCDPGPCDPGPREAASST